ncbi:MAG TPA: hypothetical protein PLD20_10220 [Blastocatellia bacterium]|nr:hypothetical protein [Blastocatellia bacterium]HMV81899.1 hypothetical protein [Blastocatellia bacterium]HMX25212.1 hypothetical protein [Blastocatellia bacterium]HMY71100.1 hypothetical protein [Blastocatellia bacterium]HMZ18293.1 hypothetical protein [Blastocatellia bacterium]
MPPWELTSEAFNKLLESFDANPDRAAEKYEDTRRMLARVFSWGGTLFPDELVDEVFNRVAKKLAAGEVIGNLGGYCYRTAINLRFENSQKPRSEELPPNLPDNRKSETEFIEQLAQCQDDCLLTLPADSYIFILEYYQDDGRARIERRQKIADRLGLSREALANRAQRLRHKLEKCITNCQKKKDSI